MGKNPFGRAIPAVLSAALLILMRRRYHYA